MSEAQISTAAAKILQASMLLFVLMTSLTAQEQNAKSLMIDFTKPLNQCKELTGKSDQLLSASDNTIFFTTNGFDIISSNSKDKIKNWKTELPGKIISKLFTDNQQIFVISSNQNNKSDSKPTYTLISISFTTGIINWQTALRTNAEIQLISESLIILRSEDNSIDTFEKTEGIKIWTKNFESKIVSIHIIFPEEVRIIFEDRIIDVNSNNGENSKQIKLQTKSISSLISSKDSIFYGNTTGEIVKLTLLNDNPKILWKVKTGGNITNLSEINNGILATSLDNFIYFFNKLNGKLIWKKRLGGRVVYKPLFSSEFIIAIDSGDNIVSVIDINSGKIINQVELNADSFFISSPIISAKTVLIPTNRATFSFSDMAC